MEQLAKEHGKLFKSILSIEKRNNLQQIKKYFKDNKDFKKKNSLREGGRKIFILLLLAKFHLQLTYKRRLKDTPYQNIAFLFLR